MSLFNRIARRRSPSRPQPGKRCRRRLLFESSEARCLLSADGMEFCPSDPVEETRGVEFASIATAQDDTEAKDAPSPVLLVISNQDFWYQDYADTRASLEAAGLDVVVAAATTEVARPHRGSGEGSDGGFVSPDLALADVDADDYSAIVFSGGWGMAQYQYGFEGTYHNSAYNGDDATKQVTQQLIEEFVRQDKQVAAVCYGVSVLAYARVDGQSLLSGREVTGWNGPAPAADGQYQSSRAQIESSGARVALSGAVGDPSTSTDDVIVDGNIITAENYDSAAHFGTVVATEVIASHNSQTDPPADPEGDENERETQPKPVLMVIANQDFYHREYYETRESLEAAGLEVVVAAATTETATPHAISVVEGREPLVHPDLALADVEAQDYSSIVFVGGYGAASYQYAYEGTYDNLVYRGDDAVKAKLNQLINDFVAQEKYLTAICNGVSVLAWARVDGVSPLEGHTVAAWAEQLPSANGGEIQTTRGQIEANGADQVDSGSVGDPTTAEDDVIVDGNIITAENYDSARLFGAVVAETLIAQAQSQSQAAQSATHDEALTQLMTG